VVVVQAILKKGGGEISNVKPSHEDKVSKPAAGPLSNRTNKKETEVYLHTLLLLPTPSLSVGMVRMF